LQYDCIQFPVPEHLIRERGSNAMKLERKAMFNRCFENAAALTVIVFIGLGYSQCLLQLAGIA
jgi:hypothetical protein